ncbi:MAG TPA: ABC transporter substrate-binding protein [Bauldia sp.]|nr:ABC transporter substrate-binding protein [Bauldia sp.]
MTKLRNGLFAGLLAATMFTAAPAFAERVLSLDEAPVGEIDPAKATDYGDTVLMINVYDTLVFPKKGEPGVQPLLATEWETDGTTYTFKLRDDVKFHSGNPLTADDVTFSFARLMAIGQGFSSLFQGKVKSVEAVDPHTVRFTLTEPFAPFLAALVRLQIVDKATVLANKKDGKYGEFGDYGEEFLSAKDAGSGAYTIESQNPQSETIMVKNPDYFLGFAENAPDRVRYRYGMEASTVRAALSRGEHDIASLWLPPEVIKALAEEDGISLYAEGGATGEYVKLNTKRAPLDDVHCRLALTYAFDYDTALTLLKINDDFAQGIPARGPIPSGLLGYDASAPAYKQDLEKAKAELAQCKYDPAEYPLELSWIAEVPARERIALLMKANFEAIGFKANVTKVPWALLTEQVTKPETTPHAAEIAVAAVTPDPDSLLFNMYSSTVPGTWMSAEHLSDAKVDELLNAGRSEADPQKRAEIYKQLNARLKELAPTIYLYELTGVFTTRDAVTIPALKDPANRYFDNFNLLFREMSIAE